jgi:hypothetical protein
MPLRLLLALVLGAVLAAVPAHAQAPASGIVVPELQDADLDLWIAKSNAVVKLLNETGRPRDSFNRYASWVDLNKGPTGRERIIYGLYSVNPSSIAGAVAAVRKAAGEAPAIPALDAAALELGAALEALVPIVNEAEGYYERQDYKQDKMAEGRALHARLMPAFRTTLAAADTLKARLAELKAGLDAQELARIERREGKSYRWHARRVLIAAAVAVEAVPRDPRKADVARFEAAIQPYAAVVKEFDAFVLATGKGGTLDSHPRSLLGKLRETHEKLARKRVDPNFYSFDVNGIVGQYNSMVTFSNAFDR